MKCDICGNELEEKLTSYILNINNEYIIVENVPANVCSNCDEKYYSPETVSKLQQIVWYDTKPLRKVETAVYNFL